MLAIAEGEIHRGNRTHMLADQFKHQLHTDIFNRWMLVIYYYYYCLLVVCYIIIDIDECSYMSLHKCDIEFGECINKFGSYKCGCRQGFELLIPALQPNKIYSCIGTVNVTITIT